MFWQEHEQTHEPRPPLGLHPLCPAPGSYTGKAAKSLQAESFHELGSAKATRPLVPPKPLGVGCSWSSLDSPSTGLGRLEGSALKGSTVVLPPVS